MLADLLRRMLPPVAYDTAGPVVGAVIDAEANALQAGIQRAESIAGALHPATADAAISDWERVLALASKPQVGQAERVQAVLSKLGELGGLSIPYFVRLAAAAGYAITITEPQPWRVGHSSVAEPLYLSGALFVWQVHIDKRPPGATAATDAALAAVFDDLKPAHTLCQFVEI